MSSLFWNDVYATITVNNLLGFIFIDTGIYCEYNKLMKAKRNVECLAMIDESRAQLERGETISFSMEELRAMESDDWQPTQKVLVSRNH